jgi:hypothetical protein
MALTEVELFKKSIQNNVCNSSEYSAAETTIRKLFRRTYTIAVADAATAGTAVTETVMIPYVERLSRVKAVRIATPIAVTAHDTTYATFSVAGRVAGAASTAIASHTTKITAGLGNLTAFAPYSLTLSATDANLTLAAGSSVTVAIAKASTGVALTAATSYVVVEVDLEEI